MVETSKELSSERIERLELIARLADHPGFKALCDELEELEEKWYSNFARGLARNPGPVDQREVDEKRGYWEACRFVGRIVKLRTKELEKFLVEANKESDAA